MDRQTTGWCYLEYCRTPEEHSRVKSSLMLIFYVWADSSDIHIQGENSWGQSHDTNETVFRIWRHRFADHVCCEFAYVHPKKKKRFKSKVGWKLSWEIKKLKYEFSENGEENTCIQWGKGRDGQREQSLGQLVTVSLYSHFTWLPKCKENSWFLPSPALSMKPSVTKTNLSLPHWLVQKALYTCMKQK